MTPPRRRPRRFSPVRRVPSPERAAQQRAALRRLDELAQHTVVELDVYQAIRERIEAGDVSWFRAIESFLAMIPLDSDHATNDIRGAMLLANAEAYAEEAGWDVRWEHDPDGWRAAQMDESAFYLAGLKDVVRAGLYESNLPDAKLLEDSGAIGYHDFDDVQTRNFQRVLAADMVLDAIESLA